MNKKQISTLINNNFNQIFKAFEQHLNIKKPKLYIAYNNKHFKNLFNNKTLFVNKIDEQQANDFAAIALPIYNEIIININLVDKNNTKYDIISILAHEFWHLYENYHFSLNFYQNKKIFENIISIRDKQIHDLNSKYFMLIKNYMFQKFRKNALSDYYIQKQIYYLLQKSEIAAFCFSQACRNEAQLFHIIFKDIYNINTISIYNNLENILWI